MLHEIERETFGHDARAINKHSIRIYTDQGGNLYQLDLTLDGIPPFFSASGPYRPDFIGILPRLKIKGQDYWGSGWGWEKAEQLFIEAVVSRKSEV